MAIRPPTMNTVNVPASIGAAENLKGAKTRNALLGHQVEELDRSKQMRERVAAARRLTDNAGEAVAQLRADGQFEAADQLLQTARTQYQGTLEVLESARGWVNKDNYKQVRSHLLQEGAIEPDDMPTEYSDSFFDRKIKDVNNKLSKLTVTEPGDDGRVMSRDILQTGYGEAVYQGAPYEDSANRKARVGGDGKPWEMKASDSNTIGRSVGEFLGATYSPITGTFSGLNREEAQQAITIKEEASRIFREGQGQISHEEATAAAVRQFGVAIRSIQDERATDPAGIRNPLNP